MKLKYPIIFCAFFFFAGYCLNVVLPVNYFMAHPSNIVNIRNLPASESMKPVDSHKSPVENNSTYIHAGNSAAPSQAGSFAKAGTLEDRIDTKDENLAALHNELLMLREYRMQIEINRHNQFLESNGGGSFEALNNHFKSEPLDSVWAVEKEALINNFSDQNSQLSKIPHLASECRSTQCKLSLLSDDQFYLNKLTDSLNKMVVENGAGFSSYSTVVDENTHTTNIYFDRNTNEVQQNSNVSR